jgi:hypothetical protein
MVSAARPRPLARLLALVVLAYGLAMNGLLGSIAAGAHVTEARMAAQLGVICTIHGILGDDTGQSHDPTPGKLACIEHCVLVSAGPMPAIAVLASHLDRPDLLAEGGNLPVMDDGDRIAPVASPPPPRGPPPLI